MKLQTALRYAREIAQQLHDCEGRIPTPLHSSEYVEVYRVCVFGSTARGKAAPNDLDLMVGYIEGPNTQGATLLSLGEGIWWVEKSSTLMCKWFRKGRKKVSVHSPAWDEVRPAEMYEIYPEWRFPPDICQTN